MQGSHQLPVVDLQADDRGLPDQCSTWPEWASDRRARHWPPSLFAPPTRPPLHSTKPGTTCLEHAYHSLLDIVDVGVDEIKRFAFVDRLDSLRSSNGSAQPRHTIASNTGMSGKHMSTKWTLTPNHRLQTGLGMMTNSRIIEECCC